MQREDACSRTTSTTAHFFSGVVRLYRLSINQTVWASSSAEADRRSTPAAATAHSMVGGAGPRAVNRAPTAPMAAARAYFCVSCSAWAYRLVVTRIKFQKPWTSKKWTNLLTYSVDHFGDRWRYSFTYSVDYFGKKVKLEETGRNWAKLDEIRRKTQQNWWTLGKLGKTRQNWAKVEKIEFHWKNLKWMMYVYGFLLADLVVRYFFGARVLSHEAYRLLTAAIQIPALDWCITLRDVRTSTIKDYIIIAFFFWFKF